LSTAPPHSVSRLNGEIQAELAGLKPAVLRAVAKCFDDLVLIRAQNDGAIYADAAEALANCRAWLARECPLGGQSLRSSAVTTLLLRPPVCPELWSSVDRVDEAGEEASGGGGGGASLEDVRTFRLGIEQAARITRVVMNNSGVIINQRESRPMT
jgi:hypothetical protein